MKKAIFLNLITTRVSILDMRVFNPTLCLVLSISIWSFKAAAESHMLIMGGGGEPAKNDTIFDPGMTEFAKNVKGSKWKYDVSFDGGHMLTEAMIASKYPEAQSSTSFTAENYKKLIDSYKAKILLGEIKNGDQLMVIMSTHGAINDGSDETHNIAVKGKTATNLNTLADADRVSMDALKELVKLADQKGIKLGIVDLSCHSGSTIKLKSPNTCVVTATGPSHYGFAGSEAFTDIFLKNLKPGQSMEQAFLKSRLEARDASYPMISTDEHQAIADEVYKNLTPYLYYYDDKSDKLTKYMTETATSLNMCARESQFKKLISKIDELNKIIPSSQTIELKKLLTSYKAQQDSLIKRISTLGGEFKDKKETFNTPVAFPKSKPITHSYTWKQIIEDTQLDRMIDHYALRTATSKGKEKAEYQALLEHNRIIKAKRDEILAKYPKLKTYEEEAKKIASDMTANRATAEKIADQEKKFYDDLYKTKQGLNFDDPCRKIVF